MGGFIYLGQPETFPITALQMAKNPIFKTPRCVPEDIEEKSKQDWLAKTFASLQILQLVLSIITRHIKKLQYSQLEVVTLAFAICGVLIYLTYLYKPQKVERPFYIGRMGSPIPNDLAAARQISLSTPPFNQVAVVPDPLEFEATYDSLWAIVLDKQRGPSGRNLDVPHRIPNDNIPIHDGDFHPAVYFLAVASGLFGAIHAIAWNSEFPTEVERLLWRISTVVTATSPFVGLLGNPLAQFTRSSGDSQSFICNRLRLLQEYFWKTNDKTQVMEAIEKLEDALADNRQKTYLEILYLELYARPFHFLDDLERFLVETEADETDFGPKKDEAFIEQFKNLALVIKDKDNPSKRLVNAARVGKWPKESLLPKGFNRGLIFLTAFLYCSSRVLLLGISVSSLRLMPDSVYTQSDWTQYLPTFGSSGG
ncbi:hypothetical protein J3459_011907 [Metarhizium acridum]|uniref:uncharacterized protein n=1 Tax=Metarhizium acridum TaxID=92637 RepID=UPI001C6C407C|nr:hypothetical protein J3458_022094 [Metarhizium acridum]KAG8418927.1 hypothetical protein J3459_011907 [Metarhizium acridum]